MKAVECCGVSSKAVLKLCEAVQQALVATSGGVCLYEARDLLESFFFTKECGEAVIGMVKDSLNV